MANYLGIVSWGIVPLNWSDSNLGSMSWDYRANYLKSANDQLRYQVQWMKAGLNEGVEPSKDNYTGGKVLMVLIGLLLERLRNQEMLQIKDMKLEGSLLVIGLR